MSHLYELLVDLSPLHAVLLKITLVVALGWISYAMILRYNPRWRVLLWRLVIMGMILIPVLEPIGYLEVAIDPYVEPTVVEKPLAIQPSPLIVPYERFETVSESIATAEPVEYLPAIDSQTVSFSIIAWIQQNYGALLLSVWMSGVILLGLREGYLWFGLRRKMRLVRSAPEDLQQYLGQVAKRLSYGQPIRLGYSDAFSSPFVTGLLKPALILPARLVKAKYRRELSAIFAHEIAHLQSRDIIWLNLFRIVGHLLWFHPLVWRIRSVHSSACEAVCDGVGAEYVGNVESYSGTLARVALGVVEKIPAFGGIPMARSSEIVTRLRLLKQRITSARLARRKIVLSGVVGFMLLAVIGGVSLVYAESSTEEPHGPEGYPAKLIDGIEPLPQDQYDGMLGRIGKDEEIDLKLIYQCLNGDQTTLRAYAARYLGTHGNRTSIPYLIDALADESMHVGALYPEAGMATTRYWANDSLKKLTGHDFGFIWNDPKDIRVEAILRWQQWWQEDNQEPQGHPTDTLRPERNKDQVQGWVEDFFKHNYRDITARKTLEWGVPVVDDEGNVSIRYKYEATIWDKDKIVENKVWTFDKQGKMIHVRKVGAEDIYSLAGVQALVGNFFANNYQDITHRKTLEWGQPIKQDNGNVSIRYKYEATIRDKKVIIEDKVWTFDKKGKFISVEKSTQNPPFSTTLANGVTVELVGLCAFSNPERSWGPQGELLNERLPFHEQDGKYSCEGNQVGYEFLIRIGGYREGEIINTQMSTIPNPSIYFAQMQPSHSGTDTENFRSLWMVLDKSLKQCDLNVAVSNDEWFTAATAKPDGKSLFMKNTEGFNHVISMSPLAESNGHTIVSVSHPITDSDVRIIVIDTDGKEHLHTFQEGGTPGTFTREFKNSRFTSCKFDLPLEQVESIKLQTRRYNRVTFINVSLVPGHETDVVVELESPEGDFHKVVEKIKQYFGGKEPDGPQANFDDLIYTIDPNDIPDGMIENVQEKMIEILNERINPDVEFKALGKNKIKVMINPKKTEGKLEFRVAPVREDLMPMTSDQIDRAIKDLAEYGTMTKHEQGNPYVWREIKEGASLDARLITGEYEGRNYLLLYNSEPYVLLADGSWGFKNVAVNKDHQGRPAIDFEFDERGSPRFEALTGENLNRSLAILVDRMVYSAPTLMSKMRDRGRIAGNFSQEEADALVTLLTVGQVVKNDEVKPQGAQGHPTDVEKRAVLDLAMRLQWKMSVAYNQAALWEVLDKLLRKNGIETRVLWGSLEMAGINDDDTVTLSMDDVSVETILQDVLREVSKGKLAEADYVVHNEVVTIAAKSDLIMTPQGAEGQAAGLIDIKPGDFELRFDSERGVWYLVVSIKNENRVTIPRFKLRYYRGDLDDKLNEVGYAHRGWHNAGPIEPGKQWNERTGGFHLADGEYDFSVVLDYEKSISETDETNNTASLKAVIQDGQISSNGL